LKLLIKNPSVITAFILLVIVCVLFNPVIFGGKTFGSPDSLAPKSTGIILNKVQEKTGEYPLWQPWIFSGMPTAEAFTNISNLYFPDYIFRIFFIPGRLIQLAHLIFTGLGGFFLLKYIRCSPLSSFLGSSAFMMMPFMITMVVFGHGSQMMTAAYIPWIMYLTIKIMQKPIMLILGFLRF